MSEFCDYVKTSRSFASMQDHPMIYSLVLAKLAKVDKASAKKDDALFNVLNRVEKVIPAIDSNKLKTTYSPMGMAALFNSETTKKALPDYVKQYFNEFEKIAAHEEKTFDGAYKVHKQFADLTNSDEFKNFLLAL